MSPFLTYRSRFRLSISSSCFSCSCNAAKVAAKLAEAISMALFLPYFFSRSLASRSRAAKALCSIYTMIQKILFMTILNNILIM
jgi:hypothetical protein